ncbi:MAG TPA: cupin domain-containing protein [Chloroflexota bacterium]|nr:cupin domain-containing protein [Chloroflexota bacterium]
MAISTPDKQESIIRERASTNIFPYDTYMEGEGIPIHRAVVGVDDVTTLERTKWARTGGRGAFIVLNGTFESERGIYVADIPGGGALEPEKHLYEEEIFILAGRGLTEVWQGSGKKITFEWETGSVFAIPPNATHRMLNGSREEVVFLAATTAPRVMDAVFDLGVVFDSDYQFVDLYAHDNYFLIPEQKTTEGWYQQGIVHTNFIPDARRMMLDDLGRKVAGGQLTGYRMGHRFPAGHVSEWPAGRYHKAHYHGPGAILLGLDGEGYVLAWDSKLGPRPYQSGHGDEVYKVNWTRNSIYSPPNAYFHQHFNTGHGPAKHIAVYGEHHPMGVHNMEEETGWKGFKSFREGGTLIEYEEEDPQIRADFEAELRSKGIPMAMEPVTYRE